MSNYSCIKEVAEHLAKKAGKYIVEVKGRARITKQKDILDICTSADLDSEKIIIDGIKSEFPDHSIYSEESGLDGQSSAFRWIIDPIDGTKEYIRGIPLFNVSIAIEQNNILIVSVVYRPSDDSLYSASLGEGAFLNGHKIHVSNIIDLPQSFVYTYLPSFFRNSRDYQSNWAKLGKLGESIYRLRSLADENTMLCWLAQGGHEAYVNISNSPKWYDIAPGLLIAQEAGGFVPSHLIQNIKTGKNCSIVITNNATIYQEIEKTLGD